MPRKIKKRAPKASATRTNPLKTRTQNLPDTFSRNLQALGKVLPPVARALSPSAFTQANSSSAALATKPFTPIRTDVDSITLALGCDTLASFLRQQAGTDISRIRLLILLEDNPAALHRFLQVFDIASSLLGGSMLIVCRGEGEWNLAVELRNRCIANPHILALARSIQILGSPEHTELQGDFFKRYLDQVRTGLHEGRTYYGNDPHDSLIGIENMFENLDLIVENPGVNCFKDAFRGVPAFIVATGPSLDEALPLLKDAVRRGLVFACDASVKPMVEAGVDFQLVSSVERKPMVSKFFATCDASRSYLCAPPLQNRHIFNSFSGKKIITYRNVKHFDWIHLDRGTLDIKSSVANMAYVIADYMGCDPIILVGQDLSYGDTGSTHANNFAIEEAIAIEKSRQKFAVPSNNGTQVLTHQLWYSCIKSYEVDIARSKAKTINTTLRGARIEGTQVMPLEQVLESLFVHEHDFRPLLEARIHQFETMPKHEVYQSLEKRIQQGLSHCQSVLKACSEARSAILPFIQGELSELLQMRRDNISPERVNEQYDMVLKLKQSIVESGGDTYECLIMHVFQSYVLDDLIQEKELHFRYQAEHMARINGIARFPKWIDECIKHTTSVEKVLRRYTAQLHTSEQ